MRYLSLTLPDGDTVAWEFSGSVAEACHDEIENLIIQSDELTDRKLSVTCRVYDGTAHNAAGWMAESVIQDRFGLSARITPDNTVEIITGFCAFPIPVQAINYYARMIMYGLLPYVLDGRALIVHGALLVKGNAGVVLCAASGTGKTTCSRRVQAPWRALADDMVLLFRCYGDIYAQPLPTFSQTYFREDRNPVDWNYAVRLAGMLVLKQAPADSVTELSSMAKRHVAIMAFDDLRKKWCVNRKSMLHRLMAEKELDFASDIVTKCNAYQLNCSLHGKFWEELDDVLFDRANGPPFDKI